jgi:hypothetical protein
LFFLPAIACDPDPDPDPNLTPGTSSCALTVSGGVTFSVPCGTQTNAIAGANKLVWGNGGESATHSLTCTFETPNPPTVTTYSETSPPPVGCACALTEKDTGQQWASGNSALTMKGTCRLEITSLVAETNNYPIKGTMSGTLLRTGSADVEVRFDLR